MLLIRSLKVISVLDHATMARHLDATLAPAPSLTLDHVHHGDPKLRRLAIAALAENYPYHRRPGGLMPMKAGGTLRVFGWLSTRPSLTI